MQPHLHSPVMSSLPLPLGVPPFPTGRIPKSDPLEEKLQDMLRYNMEKYAGQHLDTLGMSRRVRELLSIHNIGQRLFAKYVLGLSQGTVSELLSKPKAWEKLTEKGRDSYRKMHAWCYDENAVMMLKSLIPRKGELMRSVPPAPLMMKGKSAIKDCFMELLLLPDLSENQLNATLTQRRELGCRNKTTAHKSTTDS